jgi:hypothetical protein
MAELQAAVKSSTHCRPIQMRPGSPSPSVRTDATLNPGHVATICAIGGGGGAAYTSLDGRIASVEKQVVDIPDLKTLVRQQQVQIDALGKQDDIFRENMRRMSDYLS